MAEVNRENRDLVLSPTSYVYMQDTSKGDIKVYAGPTSVTQTGQDLPVVYDPETDSYETCSDLRGAVRKRPLAVQRDYLVLFNPALDGGHPEPGCSGRKSVELDFGRKVNIPGPCEFPLWPGQAAVRIPGHHLRSNQFLLVKVYDAEEARKNWDSAVVETKTETPDGEKKDKEPKKAPQISTVPKDLAVGKHYVVKGTEVSFYIPPTGVSVVQNHNGQFVRDALTLERLEYAILVDEDGNKEYPMGPSVVFPKPTQNFVSDKRGNIKFRAIELNPLQGIHAKVIAPYTDEKGNKHEVGEELFIRGDETPIFYPREELSLISYDGKSKHFATAIPAGEARYVLNRMSGEIRTVHGPTMLLPDPRHEVIIRRVLTDNQCSLWYPGNDEVLEYNQILRAMSANAPTTRAGVVSEGEFERSTKGKGRGAKYRNVSNSALMEQSFTSSFNAEESHFVADEFTRASNYTQPRTVTLNTKLEGVPMINVWTGYAIQIVDKQGNRRVVEGPATVLLNYDEELEAMSLSTGKPKTTDVLFHTPYLRVKNNKVSDIVTVETADHVGITVKMSYRVDFVDDANLWFSVENYVKVLCDHVKSVLKGAIQKIPVAEFYAKSVDIIRDLVLGPKPEKGDRPGMTFGENGMSIVDVDVLKVHIQDDRIHKLLNDSQHQAVSSNIELQAARRELQAATEREALNRKHIQLQVDTTMKKLEAQALIANEELGNRLQMIQADASKQLEEHKVVEAKEATENFRTDAKLARQLKVNEQDLAFGARQLELHVAELEADTKAAVERFGAAQGGFSEALIAMSRDETAVKVAEASSIERFIGGRSFGGALETIFTGAPELIKRVTGNGEKIHKAAYARDPSRPE